MQATEKTERVFIRCGEEHFAAASDLYRRVTKHLEETINYPKWRKEHPSDTQIAAAIRDGNLYACLIDGAMVGAVVLNEDPEGDYDAGDWRADLKAGEYFVLHMLAVDPSSANKGIGGYVVDRCAETAKRGGYKGIRLDVVPGNVPAIHLYRKKGFVYAGTKDLRRHFDDIPVFDLYELNF